MSFREIRADAIIDNFKNQIVSMEFIEESERKEIEERLNVLMDFEQNRYKCIESAKWLWKHLLAKSLSDITKNLRGYDKLCKYFDEYIEYETLLFALDENHRDHVIHSIWVMLIGFYLRKHYALFTNIDYDVILDLQKSEESKSQIKEVLKITKEHEDSLWCLIALTHDLGYPIEKTSKANMIMTKMITNFGFLEQEEFRYKFTALHEPVINSLLDNLSYYLVWISDIGHSLITMSGSRLDAAKSLEGLEHGIMSAYLLQNYIDRICEVLSSMGELEAQHAFTDTVRGSERVIFITWLQAIAYHTSQNRYWTTWDNFAAILFICDELDEFSRYSRSLTSDEWIRMNCRTECECTEKRFQIKYTFDNKNIGDNIEEFFRMKVRKMYGRLELRHDRCLELSLECKDVRKAEPVEYIYKKKLIGERSSEELIINGKICSNILDYLDGTISN